MKEYFVQDKLATVRSVLKLQAKAQTENEEAFLGLAMNRPIVSNAAWLKARAIDDASDAEDAGAAYVATHGDIQTLFPGGVSFQTSQVWKFHAIGDPNPLLQQEGLQLAEASFLHLN